MQKISFLLFLLLLTFTSIGQNNLIEIPNSTKSTSPDGKELIKIIVPGSPPPKLYLAKTASISAAAVMISDVPTLDWCYGCTPTSAAMAAGYYDRNGYANIYTGPTNGGIFPLTNSVWGNGQCPLSASHLGLDGRITRGHVEDYWIEYNSSNPDPYITNSWTAHSSDCTADFMKTSQSAFGNSDGSTTIYFWTDGSPFASTSYDEDGGYGFQLFMESKGYTVVNRYNQYLPGHGTDPTLGFSFTNYKTEIDNNRPVFIHLTGHTVLGVGYDDATQTVYIHDTWDHSTHNMTWAGSYSGMSHYAVTVLELQSVAPTVSATITNNNYTYDGTTKNVTVTTTPAGLSNTVTYLQSSTPVANPKNAGTYNVVVTITQPGYTSEGPFYGTLTINKKNLSATANNQSVNYGDPEPTYSISYSGFVSGENTGNLTTIPVADITEAWPANPGTYTIYVSGGSAANYNISNYNGTLTVVGLSVNSVSISNYLHSYDGNNKEVSVTTDPPGIGNNVVYSVSGLVVAAPTNAATYDVTITINEPGYNPDVFSSTMTIEKTTLTATANNQSVNYGEAEPTYTISYSGFASGENTTNLTTTPVADITEAWPAAPGTYTIYVNGGNDENYNFAYNNGTLTVVGLSVNGVVVTNNTYTYNGSNKTVTVTTDPPGVNNVVAYKLAGQAIAAPTNVATYDVTITINEPGYNPDKFYSTLSINRAALTAQANNQTVNYGDPEPIYTINYSGFVNGENVSVLDAAPLADVTGTWPLAPGTYPIEVSGGSDNNYLLSKTNGTLTVSALKADSVKFTSIIQTYNGIQHTPIITTYPNNLSYNLDFFDLAANQLASIIDAGVYFVKLTITEPGYIQDVFTKQLTIKKADLQISAANVTITYGASEPSFTLLYSGFVNGETKSVLDALPLANIAENWPVLPGTYTISITGGHDNNYNYITNNGTLTVNPNVVNNVDFSNLVKTYNGLAQTPTFSVDPGNIDYTITYLNSNQDQVIAPIKAGSYQVTLQITETGYRQDIFQQNFTISKAELLVSAANITVNYGDPEPEYPLNLFGFVNNENINNLTLAPIAGIQESWPVLPGNYIIRAALGIDENYNFSYIDGLLTVKALSDISLDITNNSHIYDGTEKEVSVSTTPAGIAYSINYSQNGVLVSSPVNAGNYQVTATVTEPGYSPDQFNSTLIIGKAALSATANYQSIIYGKPEPTYTINYQGFVPGENINVIDVLPNANVNGNWPLVPGNYSIIVSGGSDNNYNITAINGQLTVAPAQVDSLKFADLFYAYDGIAHQATVLIYPGTVDFETTYTNADNQIVPLPTDAGIYLVTTTVTELGFIHDTFYQNLHIEKAILTASVKDTTIDYGDPEPEYTILLSGFVAGDNPSQIDVMPLAKVEGERPLMPGIYPIELTGGFDNNYSILTNNGTLKVESNGVSIAISDTLVTYNGLARQIKVKTIPPGIQYQTIYYNETQNIIPAPSASGTYRAKVSITEPGFEALEKYTSFLIKKASLTLSVHDKTIYFGEVLPEFTYSIVGFVNGENESIISKLPTIQLAGTPPLLPGIYPINASTGEAANYNFSYQNGQLTVLPLNFNAIGITDTIPVYNGLAQTLAVTNVPNGATVVVKYFDENNQLVNLPVNAGRYNYKVIVSATGYIPFEKNGQFEIKPAQLVVSIKTIELTYGADKPEPELTFNGFVNGESPTVLSAMPTLVPLIDWPLNTGIYELETNGGIAGNYTLIYEPGKLIVNKAILTVTPNNFTITYNNPLPDFTYNLTGFVLGEDQSVLIELPIVKTEEENPQLPKTYILIATGGSAQNYTFNYNTGKLTIEPIGSAEISLTDTVANYNGLAQEVSVTTTPAGLSYSIEYNQQAVNAGTYYVIATLTEPGYAPVINTTTLRIKKAMLTATPYDLAMLMGDEIPPLNFDLSGFVNNETFEVIDQLPIGFIEEPLPLAAGAHSIILSGGFDNNYDFTYQNGNLIVIQTYMLKVYASINGKVATGETATRQDSIWERLAINEASSNFYAIPDDKFAFIGWDNGSTENPIRFTSVNNDITISAIFAPKTGIDLLLNKNILFRVHPNPVDVSQIINIVVDLSPETYAFAKIIVSDLQGRKIIEKKQINANNPIQGLDRGIYNVTLLVNGIKIKHNRLLVK